jgi:hypothetical protein
MWLMQRKKLNYYLINKIIIKQADFQHKKLIILKLLIKNKGNLI